MFRTLLAEIARSPDGVWHLQATRNATQKSTKICNAARFRFTIPVTRSSAAGLEPPKSS
jgi:hypothetical protein